MVETWNDPIGVVGLELGIDVLFLIHIDKTDTTVAIIAVVATIVDAYFVGPCQLGSLEVDEPIHKFYLNFLPVLSDLADTLSLEIHDQLGGWVLQIEEDLSVA